MNPQPRGCSRSARVVPCLSRRRSGERGGLLVALLTRWFETHQVLEEGHVPISNLYEVTIFFTALTTVIYLVLESFSRNRHPGAFVMPIVIMAIAF